jgi:elongation factor Ts
VSTHDGAPRTPHGRVVALVEDDGRCGALLAVCCSSEALARSGKFIEYTNRLVRHVLEQAPRSVEDLAQQDWSYEGGTVLDAQRRFASVVGEGVCVQELARFAHPEGRVWAWTHPDSRSGVLMCLATQADDEVLREVAFQLAGQLLVERCGELEMGETGPVQVFDAQALGERPWARQPERSVADVLEASLGEGSRLYAYARFDVG